ncbi:MAG: PEGA domain-containing protein [Candidatus Aminicenantaceae bacterium]
MSIQRISQKKGLVYFLVLAFIILINAEFVTGRVSYDTEIPGESVVHTARIGVLASSTQQKRFETVLNEGKRLMQEEFDYEGAIQKFNEALTYAVTAQQKSDVYFFLSLAYYATLDARGRQPFENAIQKLIEVDYHRALDREICPPRYIEWYQEIKKEYGAVQILSKPAGADVYLSDRAEPVGKTPLIVGIRAGDAKITLQMGDNKKEDTIAVVAGAETLSPMYGFEIFVVSEEKPKEELPEVAVQEGVKKKGGSKTMLYVLGGIVVAGGAAAALLLGGGGTDEQSVSTGSIQVNSNPTGANVYLDGQNTGRMTNTTLPGVSPGSHRVEVLKDGYGDYETSVSVTTGQTAMVNATLSAHTIEVTQPTGSTNWTQGEDVTIRWTTGGGSSQLGFMSAPGGIGSSAHFIRMSRMRAARSNAASRRSSERSRRNGDTVSSEGTDSPARGLSINNETTTGVEGERGQVTLNTPRNTSLSRINLLGSSQSASPNNTVKPQTLNHVKIELYRGGSLEETIVSDTDNTGRYDWRVSSSISDASNYKIRVSAASDSSIRGESSNFTIARLGELRVTSIPTGATIWVDGVSKGKTNKTIEIPAGDHEVKLTLDRYQDWEDDVTVNANKRTTIEATLELGSFKENFNDGKADYYQNYSDYATWSVKNNQYQCKGPHKEWARTVYDLGKFENNWTFEAKAQRVAGRAYNVVCLVFGADDKCDVYYVLDVSPGNQMWSVWRMDDTGTHKESNVVRWTGARIIKKEGWNDLKIVAKGTNFSFYINDKLVGSKNIKSVPSSGKLGFATYVYSTVGIAAFDDVEVSVGDTTGLVAGELAVPREQKPGEGSMPAHIK